MSEHYHDVGDLRFLKEMGKLAPTEFNAWLGLDKIVGREDARVVAVTWVHSCTGVKLPIRAMADALRGIGASRDEQDRVLEERQRTVPWR